MPTPAPQPSLWRPILVGVVIALLVGGSAPWWLELLSSDPSIETTAGSTSGSSDEEPTAPTQTTSTTSGGKVGSETSTSPTTGATKSKVEPAKQTPDLVVRFPEQDAPYSCPGPTPTCLVAIEVEVVNEGNAPSTDTRLSATANAEEQSIAIGKLDPKQRASATLNFSTACYTPSCDVTASVDSVTDEELTNNNTATFMATLQYGTDHCMRPYLWRAAFDNDRACVPAEARDQALLDNAEAASRVSETDSSHGDDTCVQGYVWREAAPDDHVCVTPEVRAQTAEQNRLAPCRRVVPTAASTACT